MMSTLAESGVFVPGWLLVTVAAVGLVAGGIAVGQWMERIVSFPKLRREISDKIDGISK